ncbi:MAG: general secretion pathway protein GspB [Pseudomonadota bacterium]
MSYILEALKKAQSERQLGSAPTIHAMPVHAGGSDAALPRRALWPAVLAAAVLLAAAGGVAWWRMPAPAAPVPVPPPVVVVQAPVVQAPVVPAPVVPPPLIQAPPAEAPPPPMPVSAPAPAPAPAPAEPAAVLEDAYPYLRELPEAVQREVPQVVFGGYIYSKNPADRLLLVDKVLRREGEQVAPGLVLEKLQSKAAVMNYRGTRYRLPY